MEVWPRNEASDGRDPPRNRKSIWSVRGLTEFVRPGPGLQAASIGTVQYDLEFVRYDQGHLNYTN